MAGPVTIKLQEPVQFGTERVEELTLRAPRAKDFRRLPVAPTVSDLLDLAGALAGQPRAVMDELGVADFTAVMEAVGDFVPGGLGTGQTP